MLRLQITGGQQKVNARVSSTGSMAMETMWRDTGTLRRHLPKMGTISWVLTSADLGIVEDGLA